MGGGQETDGGRRRRRELDVKGYENIEIFSGGEEAWRGWSWKVKVATNAMSPDLMELMTMAERHHGKSTRELCTLIDDIEQRIDHARCEKASAELYSFLVRYTSSEAATVVKGAMDMDGVEAYGRLHENYSKRTLGRMFRVQRECMYPKAVKDLNGVKTAIMDWEERWKRMMAELGTDAKIPDLWRMSALLEICPKELKDQMLIRLDEIGEKYEALKAKVISYATNKVEQFKGSGPTPMDVDNVEYGLFDEEWQDEVGEVWASTRCYECGGYGHMARTCPTKGGKGGKAKGKGKDGGKDGSKGKGKDAGKGYGGKDGGKGYGGKGPAWGKGGGGKGFGQGGKGWGYQGTCWRCGKVGHKAVECGVNTNAVEEEQQDEESQEVGGVWMVGGVEEVRDETVGGCPPGLCGARLPQSVRLQGRWGGKRFCGSFGCGDGCGYVHSNRFEALKEDDDEHVHVNRYEALTKSADNMKYAVDAKNGPTKSADNMKYAIDARNGITKKADNMKYAVDAKNGPTKKEDDDDEDTKYINEVVQEVVEVTVDSGAARSVWPMKRKGVVRSKGTRKVKLAAANGSPIHVEGEATLNFSKGGKRCAMKFLDADVKRPLAAVSAIVDEGNTVVFSARGAYIENDTTKERMPMIRKNGVFMLELETDKVGMKTNMDVGAVTGGDQDEEDMVFRGRLDDEGMAVFRRRA